MDPSTPSSPVTISQRLSQGFTNIRDSIVSIGSNDARPVTAFSARSEAASACVLTSSRAETDGEPGKDGKEDEQAGASAEQPSQSSTAADGASAPESGPAAESGAGEEEAEGDEAGSERRDSDASREGGGGGPPARKPGETPWNIEKQARKEPPRDLMHLPQELQLYILRFLDFGDIERLRRTCKHFHAFAAPKVVRTLFGATQMNIILLSHCRICLRHDPFRRRLLMSTRSDPGYPLSGRCVECAVESKDGTIRVGRKVNLANFDTVWVCRWCGWPVTEGAAYGHAQFHRECYNRYNDVLLFFFIMGWVQLALGIVAAALSWRYFRGEIMVFAPSVTSFLLLWVCLGVLLFRGNRVRTYWLALLIELAILACWIPPVYFIAKGINDAGPEEDIPKSTLASLTLYALNMLFRIVNILGNIVLMSEYDLTKHHRLDVPVWKKRFVYPAISALVFWTYPQAVEQKYPPDWN